MVVSVLVLHSGPLTAVFAGFLVWFGSLVVVAVVLLSFPVTTWSVVTGLECCAVVVCLIDGSLSYQCRYGQLEAVFFV